MTVSSSTLRKLMDAGIVGEALIDLVASIEADQAPAPERSKHAIRQQRYRDRLKAQASRETSRETSRCDAPELPLVPPPPSPEPPSPTPLNPPSPSPPVGGSDPQRPRRRAKPEGHRIPDDFTPNITAAIDEGLPEARARREAERFIDYWRSRAGSGARRTDWSAMWRIWFRDALDRLPLNRRGPVRSPELFSTVHAKPAESKRSALDRRIAELEAMPDDDEEESRPTADQGLEAVVRGLS